VPDRNDGHGGRAAGDAAIFLSATVGALLLGIVSGVVTARALGPEARGIYSVTVLLIGIFTPFGSLGLGDAAMVEIRRGGAEPSDVAGSTALATGLATILAGLAVGGALLLTVPAAGVPLLLAAASGVVLGAASASLSPVLVATGGSRTSSAAFLATSAATTATLTVWLVFVRGGVTAAVLAGSVGATAGCLVILRGLRTRGVAARLRWDAAYIRRALRYGIPLQVGVVLASLTARVDLLVVYSLEDATAAGHYSVALTIAAVAAIAASSVAYGAFPHIAAAEPSTAPSLAQRTMRAGTAATAASTPVLALAAFLTIPIVFGHEYSVAAAPGAVLAVAGALNGILFLAARLAAASGDPKVLPASSAAFLLVMLAGDLALIPPFGILGAAVAAVIGAAAGAVVALRSLNHLIPGAVTRETLPRTRDFGELLKLPVTLLGPRLRSHR
jgi:O-antigen/teichoic acid export membrane protein